VAAVSVELERRLPPLEMGYTRGVVGAHVVIYNPQQNWCDIMKDVVALSPGD